MANDDRFRSRKWRLSLTILGLATALTVLVLVMAWSALLGGFVDAQIWYRADVAALTFWSVVAAAVGAAYGVANIAAMRVTNGRGAG